MAEGYDNIYGELAKKQDKNSLFIVSQSYSITQTFDISNRGFINPIFMLTVGYTTNGMTAIIYLNGISETQISYQKISNMGDIDISNISYDGNGTITITFTKAPYRRANLLLLSNN